MSPTHTTVPPDCRIKGNISGSERVYHTLDSPWYDITDIDTSKGERWFCSEQEAEDAGWEAPKRTRQGEPKPCQGRININTADAEELDMLPGIGPTLAQRIVEYRSANGDFTSIDQLDHVERIGPETLKKIIDCVFVE